MHWEQKEVVLALAVAELHAVAVAELRAVAVAELRAVAVAVAVLDIFTMFSGLAVIQ